MTLLHAFVDQIIFAIFFAIRCYLQRDAFPDSFFTEGNILLFLLINFVFITWMRWYMQMPLIGVVGYLFE